MLLPPSEPNAALHDFYVVRGEIGYGVVLINKSGAAVIDAASGNARDVGLRAGDVVVAVNGVVTASYTDALAAIRKCKLEMSIRVRRPQRTGWGFFASSVLVALNGSLFGGGTLSDAAFADLLAKQQNTDVEQLTRAVTAGDVEGVEETLSRGVDLNTPNAIGDTPLVIAAWNAHLDICRVLLRGGARLDDVNSEGNSPLGCAAYRGNTEVVRLLISHGAPLEQRDHLTSKTPLIKACYAGRTEAVTELLCAGADMDAVDAKGYGGLAFAISFEHDDVVTALLQAKADVNVQDIFGVTPLIHAGARGSASQVRQLLRAGADASIRDIDERCALDYAEASGYDDVCALLDPKGGRPALATGGATARDCAAAPMTPRIPVGRNEGEISVGAQQQPRVVTCDQISPKDLARLDSESFNRLTWQLVQVARSLARRDSAMQDAQYPSYG